MTVKLDVEAQAFTFKGGMLPMTVIELLSADLEQIDHQLSRKINQSPAFFHQTPVVISIEKLDKLTLSLDTLCRILRAHQLMPVAVRGGGERIKKAAAELSMGWFPGRDNKIITVHDQDFPLKVKKPENHKPNSKILRNTIRSGQQLCAFEGDLVVVGAVNAGAEILAAGSIHVYGPLRGRALAGIHGDQEVAIFCHELHAELLSIAGNYKRLEDIPPYLLGKSVQVKLNADQLEICAFDPARSS